MRAGLLSQQQEYYKFEANLGYRVRHPTPKKQPQLYQNHPSEVSTVPRSPSVLRFHKRPSICYVGHGLFVLLPDGYTFKSPRHHCSRVAIGKAVALSGPRMLIC